MSILRVPLLLALAFVYDLAAQEIHNDEFTHALSEATRSVKEVEGAHESLSRSAADENAIVAHTASIQKRVLAAFKERRARLLDKFDKLENMTIAKLGENITKAGQDLAELRSTQESLNTLDDNMLSELKARMKEEEENTRKNEKNVNKRMRQLARAARKKTDQLDNIARKFNFPDKAAELQDRAERSAEEVQNQVASLARFAQDTTQHQLRQVEQSYKYSRQRRATTVRKVAAALDMKTKQEKVIQAKSVPEHKEMKSASTVHQAPYASTEQAQRPTKTKSASVHEEEKSTEHMKQASQTSASQAAGSAEKVEASENKNVHAQRKANAQNTERFAHSLSVATSSVKEVENACQVLDHGFPDEQALSAKIDAVEKEANAPFKDSYNQLQVQFDALEQSANFETSQHMVNAPQDIEKLQQTQGELNALDARFLTALNASLHKELEHEQKAAKDAFARVRLLAIAARQQTVQLADDARRYNAIGKVNALQRREDSAVADAENRASSLVRLTQHISQRCMQRAQQTALDAREMRVSTILKVSTGSASAITQLVRRDEVQVVSPALRRDSSTRVPAGVAVAGLCALALTTASLVVARRRSRSNTHYSEPLLA